MVSNVFQTQHLCILLSFVQSVELDVRCCWFVSALPVRIASYKWHATLWFMCAQIKQPYSLYNSESNIEPRVTLFVLWFPWLQNCFIQSLWSNIYKYIYIYVIDSSFMCYHVCINENICNDHVHFRTDLIDMCCLFFQILWKDGLRTFFHITLTFIPLYDLLIHIHVFFSMDWWKLTCFH